MKEENAAFSREVFRRILRTLGVFLNSAAGGKAKWLLAGLFLLMFRFTEERLGLLWRDFLTPRVVALYIDNGVYLVQLIPVLIVAPLFIRREVEFGVLGQATMAFATLLGAFSLIITRFQAISAYASGILRLGEFVESADRCDPNNTET